MILPGIHTKQINSTSALHVTPHQTSVWSKHDWFALLTLFLMTTAYFHNVLIPLDASILSSQNTDTHHQLFYWRYFGFKTLSQGIIPLWNPYIYSGAPFVAGVQSAVFYPLNLIFLVLPVHVAINYSIMLHIFLSGVFTYLYLRHLGLSKAEQKSGPSHIGGLSRPSCIIASIIFMFCAPQIFHVYPGHLPNLCTMIWLPLILLFLELFLRTRDIFYVLSGGIAVACNILAGHPQYFFYTAIAVVVYCIIRIIQEFYGHKSWKYVAHHMTGLFVLYLAGVLLATIQLLPAFEMVKHSTRQALSYEWVGQFSFAPENFLTFFIPDFFGDMLKSPYWGRYYLWEMSLYIGILPFMLCAFASFYFRNTYTKTFLILAFCMMILALGKFTPVFKILYTVVPGFDLFRGNSKFIFIVAFSLSVLSGIGSEYLQDTVTAKKGKSSLLYIITGIVVIISLFLLIFFFFGTGYGAWQGIINKIYLLGDRYVALPNLNDPGFLQTTFAVTTKSAAKCILLAIVSLLVIGLWIRGGTHRKILIPLTIALVFGDLWFFGNRYMVTFDSNKCLWEEGVVKVIKSDPEPSRITTIGYFELNKGMAHAIAHVGGYDANVIKEYSEFINVSSNKPLDEPNIVMEVKQISRLTNLLNVKYLLLPAHARIDHPSMKRVFHDQKYAIYQNTLAFPRAFVVHSAKTIQGRDAIFNEMTSKEFNPLHAVILEEPSGLTGNMTREDLSGEPSPTITEYLPNSIKINARLLEDGFLVLGDTYYPGWNVYVDGKKSKVLKANYILRAVFLEKGEHHVRFVYEPKSFTLGMYVSVASLAMVITALFMAKNYQSRNTGWISR
ncbi:MAG: YfhO family protein [Candidatus Brocadiaceae bacterium]|nr:YfhO family protein [Candidatus Brocadiaceae bacterium]